MKACHGRSKTEAFIPSARQISNLQPTLRRLHHHRDVCGVRDLADRVSVSALRLDFWESGKLLYVQAFQKMKHELLEEFGACERLGQSATHSCTRRSGTPFEQNYCVTSSSTCRCDCPFCARTIGSQTSDFTCCLLPVPYSSWHAASCCCRNCSSCQACPGDAPDLPSKCKCAAQLGNARRVFLLQMRLLQSWQRKGFSH